MIARRGSIDPGDCALTVSLFLSTPLSLTLSLSLSPSGIYTRVLPFPVRRVPPCSFYLSFLLFLTPVGASHPYTGWRAGWVQGHACTPFACASAPSFLPFRRERACSRLDRSRRTQRGDRSSFSLTLPLSLSPAPIHGKRSPTSSTTARDQRHFRRPTYPRCVALPRCGPAERINPDLLDAGIINPLLVPRGSQPSPCYTAQERTRRCTRCGNDPDTIITTPFESSLFRVFDRPNFS